MSKTKKFFVETGGRRLVGVLHTAGEACIITCHGMESYKDSPKYIRIAERFSEEGISVCRFDFGGCGESEGNFYDINGRFDDLVTIGNFIRNEGFAKVGLLGSSLGASLAISAAEYIHAHIIVSISAPATVRIKGKMPLEVVGSLSIPIFFIHGKADELIPYEHSEMLYKRAQNPKEIWIVEGGDHRFSDERLREALIERSLEWVKANCKWGI
jgi:alpha/beta superfamily hydrolase